MLTFPLALSEFIDSSGFDMSTLWFDIPDRRRFTETRGGVIITTTVGAMLWRGGVSLTPKLNSDAARIEALVSVLKGATASFLIYDGRVPNPKYDPLGTNPDSSSAILSAVAGNMHEINVSNLSAGYTLTAGDMLMFTYGGGKRALHRVVSTKVANAGGTITSLEVTPAVRAGYAIMGSITLKKPSMKAIIVPGSISPFTGRPGTHSDGMQFEFVQSLRA